MSSKKNRFKNKSAEEIMKTYRQARKSNDDKWFQSVEKKIGNVFITKNISSDIWRISSDIYERKVYDIWYKINNFKAAKAIEDAMLSCA